MLFCSHRLPSSSLLPLGHYNQPRKQNTKDERGEQLLVHAGHFKNTNELG